MLIRTLSLDRFRGFSSLEVRDLGQVNLIVGTNNSGKTTVLEAVQLLAASGNVAILWSILAGRGEDFIEERSDVASRNVDIRRLLHRHVLERGKSFEIRSQGDLRSMSLVAKVVEPKNDTRFMGPSATFEPEPFVQALGLSLEWENGNDYVQTELELTSRGGFSTRALRQAAPAKSSSSPKTIFVTASSLTAESAVDLFEDIVLTREEDLVLDALRIIDSSIERIASTATDVGRRSTARIGARGGMLIRCKGMDERIPIGSMGDGIWRMLGLALALVRSENGILLVDEIDTGLHYSVMSEMWGLVNRAARRLNVQVFATTHSRDCYESLAAICRGNVSENSDVTIQRIERAPQRVIAYTEQEIVAAAKRGIEVR